MVTADERLQIEQEIKERQRAKNRVYMATWREKNRDKIKEKNKRYYEKRKARLQEMETRLQQLEGGTPHA